MQVIPLNPHEFLIYLTPGDIIGGKVTEIEKVHFHSFRGLTQSLIQRASHIIYADEFTQKMRYLKTRNDLLTNTLELLDMPKIPASVEG